MIAVDCTVLGDFFVGESDQQASAERLLGIDSEWISVGLVVFEFGSVLQKYVRVGRLLEPEMKQALIAAPDLLTEVVSGIDAVSVWEIASESGLSYYDASYAWLAEARGVPLYTRDGRILRALPDLARRMPGAFESDP